MSDDNLIALQVETMPHACSHSATQRDSLIQHNDHEHTQSLRLTPALW